MSTISLEALSMKSMLTKILFRLGRAHLGWNIAGNAVNIATASTWVAIWNCGVSSLSKLLMKLPKCLHADSLCPPEVNVYHVYGLSVGVILIILACRLWERRYYQVHKHSLAARNIRDLSNVEEISNTNFPVRIRRATDGNLLQYYIEFNNNDNKIETHFIFPIENNEEDFVDDFIVWQGSILGKLNDLGKRRVNDQSCLHSYKEFPFFDFNYNFDSVVLNQIENWERLIERYRAFCYAKLNSTCHKAAINNL